MSEYILLLDKTRCPKCSHFTITDSGTLSRCRNCGMTLFLRNSNLVQYETDTGWREYWVWTGIQEGWKHRSHIFDGNSNPLTRRYEVPELDSDYGTNDFIKRKLENAPDQIKKREIIKRLKKKPVTVRI